MSTTIGSLNVKVSASSVGVAEEFAKTEKTLDRVRAATTRTNAAMQQLGGGSGGGSRTGMMFQELGRGMEDFSSVYSTGGLAMGLRAASNNISQFASLLSPMAGAAAGVGIAIGTMLVPKVWEWVTSSKEGELATKRMEKAFSDFHKTLADGEAVRKTALDAGRFTDPGQVNQSVQGFKDQQKEGRTQLDALLDQRAKLEKEQAQPIVYKVGSTAGEMIGQKGAFNDQQKARGEEIKKLTEDINKGLREQDRLGKQISAVEKNRARTEEIGAAKDAIKDNDKVVAQISEMTVERNRMRGTIEAMNRSNLDSIDKEGAKRREIMRDYNQQLDTIDKSPFSETEKNDMSMRARAARDKRLGEAGVDKLNENKSLLQMQLDKLQRDRSVTPVQNAMERGSSAAVSFINRTQNKPQASAEEKQIVAQLKQLNMEIARRLQKPVQLVQGYWN